MNEIIFPNGIMYYERHELSIFVKLNDESHEILNLETNKNNTINKRILYTQFTNSEIEMLCKCFDLKVEELINIKNRGQENYSAGIISYDNRSIASLAFKRLRENTYMGIAYALSGGDPKKEPLMVYLHKALELTMSDNFIQKLKLDYYRDLGVFINIFSL
ncbi:MAG: hypothetical protein IPI77_03345 [Saprospiraceae bacterium]|nr:hypothetical protein [Saprospiraceae bacterium]